MYSTVYCDCTVYSVKCAHTALSYICLLWPPRKVSSQNWGHSRLCNYHHHCHGTIWRVTSVKNILLAAGYPPIISDTLVTGMPSPRNFSRHLIQSTGWYRISLSIVWISSWYNFTFIWSLIRKFHSCYVKLALIGWQSFRGARGGRDCQLTWLLMEHILPYLFYFETQL